MRTSPLLALAASLSTAAAAAALQGFNYGSTNTDNSAKTETDFRNEFTTAQNLVGTSGFASARLYTMIQAGTANTPISAIPAAIATRTSLLLGLWASAGQASFNNELAALSAAISQYGTAFTDLVVGISVGSEDLYRISPTGIENLSGYGAQPAEIVNYIGQLRNAIASTRLNDKPVGHVDTWTAWVNGSNSAVTSACDFLGMDAYPYFQTTLANSIDTANSTFYDAYYATVGSAQGKPVWVTETGWPVSGKTLNQAVASPANAQTYWDEVGCSLFGNINTWWYTLQDSYPITPSPSFGIVGTQLSTTPLFDLTCPAASSSASSSTAAATATSATGASTSGVSTSSRNTDAINSATTALSTGAVSSASAGQTGVRTPVPGPEQSAPASTAGASTITAASAGSSTQAVVTSRASAAASSAASSAAGPAAGAGGSAAGSAVGSTARAPVSSPAVSSRAASASAAPTEEAETTVVSTLYTTICPVSYSTYTSGSALVISPVTLSTVTYAVSTTSAAQSSAPTRAPAPAGSAPAASLAATSASSCPAALSGAYEFPHLIVPVDKSQPSKAYGTSYNGRFSSDISSVFNFDIPASYAGKTCSLVFLFPTQAQLRTSSFTLKSSGGVHVTKLNTVATQSTTYSNAGTGSEAGSVASVQPGNSYVVASGPCAAGQAVSYKADATGGLDLEYFQNYNPSPIGMYITVC